MPQLLCWCDAAKRLGVWRGLNPGKKQLIIVFCSSDNTAEQIQACCLFVKGLILCFPLEKSFLGILRFFKKGQSGKMKAIMSLSHCIRYFSALSSTVPLLILIASCLFPTFCTETCLGKSSLRSMVMLSCQGQAHVPAAPQVDLSPPACL